MTYHWEGYMKRICTVLAAAALGITTPDAAHVSDRSSGSGAGGPGKSGASVGHAKPLPPFVEKHHKERLAAADLVARGLATPDASGLVTLKNGRFVNYRLEGVEYL